MMPMCRLGTIFFRGVVSLQTTSILKRSANTMEKTALHTADFTEIGFSAVANKVRL